LPVWRWTAVALFGSLLVLAAVLVASFI